MESFEESGRLVDVEDVGSWLATEGTAGEACTTLRVLRVQDIHSFQVCSYSLEYWNMVVGHYLCGSVILPDLDFHGLVPGHGHQSRVRSSHAGEKDRWVAGMWEEEAGEGEKRSLGSS